jgi:hypothetical protein
MLNHRVETLFTLNGLFIALSPEKRAFDARA